MKQCSVSGCCEAAFVEVFLYDFYDQGGADTIVFFEQDYTCPFLCELHVLENERKARGIRKPRGDTRYPYTNRGGALGFSIYKEVEE